MDLNGSESCSIIDVEKSVSATAGLLIDLFTYSLFILLMD